MISKQIAAFFITCYCGAAAGQGFVSPPDPLVEMKAEEAPYLGKTYRVMFDRGLCRDAIRIFESIPDDVVFHVNRHYESKTSQTFHVERAEGDKYTGYSRYYVVKMQDGSVGYLSTSSLVISECILPLTPAR